MVLKRAAVFLVFAALMVWGAFETRKPYPGHTRVTFRVKDASGRATGLRMRVTNTRGEYFAPLGHMVRPDAARRSAGDVILGDGQEWPLEVHALVYDGTEMDVPHGPYVVTGRKGFEFEPVRVAFETGAVERKTVEIGLRKFEDFEGRGWYPGDTHMHFPDPSGIRYEMECEGLRVCSLLALKSGYRDARPGEGHFQNVEHFNGGRLLPVSDERHWVKTGEEFRHGLWAHLIFQNLKTLVWPVSSGGLREGGNGGYDWPMMIHATDDAHDQGALVTWAHWPYPSMEAPLAMALGKIDSIDLLTTGNPFEHHPVLVEVYRMWGPSIYSKPPLEAYYHYLNCGFRVAMSSGSDKMGTNPPMGSARTYVKTEGALSYDSWIEGIRKGRTFATNYPLMEFTVDGREAGDTLTLAPGKARVRVRARAVSIEPYDVLEIVHNGRVIRTVRPSGGRNLAVLDEVLEVDRGGWMAARAWGRKMLQYGETWWKMPVMGHTSPVYLSMAGRPARAVESARILLEQLGYLEEFVRSKAKMPGEGERQAALGEIARARKIYEGLLARE
ncbi:MAG: hypothetical protein FJW40_17180 [Acidobacteria bacterium]|nr:hypothetical protein [Acidobacteriota bacterium]